MTTFHPPKPSSQREDGQFWSYREVEERLVEAMKAWWWVEGGRWPFAGDGPWHLASRVQSAVERAEIARGLAPEGAWEAPAPRKLPLSAQQMERRDEACEWLRFVSERDRQLVLLAVAELARGRLRVRWGKVRELMRVENGTRSLGMRYSRAIAAVAKALSEGRKPPIERAER